MKAFVIEPHGKITEAIPANGTDFSLEEMYKLVKCDTIDMVTLSGGRWMVVDDNGRSNRLPVNNKATALYQKGRMTASETKALAEAQLLASGIKDIKVMVMGNDEDYNIVGNALVCDKSMIK